MSQTISGLSVVIQNLKEKSRRTSKPRVEVAVSPAFSTCPREMDPHDLARLLYMSEFLQIRGGIMGASFFRKRVRKLLWMCTQMPNMYTCIFSLILLYTIMDSLS